MARQGVKMVENAMQERPAPQPRQRYTRTDGAEVRVHMVKNDEVFFASRKPSSEDWAWIRMPIATFLEALDIERMELEVPC